MAATVLAMATTGAALHAEVPAAPAAPADPPGFVEVAAARGLVFTHSHFGTGEKYMPENMAPGVAVFDADGDGRLDVFVPQGAPLRAARDPGAVGARLFRQGPDGRFSDVTEAAGLVGTGYGMGVAVGDVDRDGDLDVFLSNFGPDQLWRNDGVDAEGQIHFTDVTAAAGVAGDRWSVGAGFFDADGDGDLDLFVATYVDFTFEGHKFCGNAQQGIRAYCHPDVYDAQPDTLWRNDGPGEDGVVRFTDVSREAGVVPSADGKGLGVAMADLDGDGHQDVLVANDSTMNFLYLGDGKGRFQESALLAGVGFNGAGAAEASMGIALGDLDGDTRPDLVLTHLDEETDTAYRNLGDGLFADVTEAVGLAAPSRPWVGFGTVAFDHDHDGDLDLVVANGHIIDNIARFDASRRHAQPAQLFDNRPENGQARFVDVSERLNLPSPLVGRGVAAGDLDGDGDLDLVIAQNDGPLLLLENRLDRPDTAVVVALQGGASNPQGYGAVLTLERGQERQVRVLASGTSYLSQGPPQVHFGVGGRWAGGPYRLLVRWPSGHLDRLEGLHAGRRYTVAEGGEGVEEEALAVAGRR